MEFQSASAEFTVAGYFEGEWRVSSVQLVFDVPLFAFELGFNIYLFLVYQVCHRGLYKKRKMYVYTSDIFMIWVDIRHQNATRRYQKHPLRTKGLRFPCYT